MASCNDQRCASAFAFENCVRCCRCAVVDELEGAGPADFLLQGLADFGNTDLNSDTLVWSCRGDFGPESLPLGREDIDVREGPAHIDTKLVTLDSCGIAHGEAKATIDGLSLVMLIPGMRERGEDWGMEKKKEEERDMGE